MMNDFFEDFDGYMDFDEPEYDTQEPEYEMNDIKEENCVLNFAKEGTEEHTEADEPVTNSVSDDLFDKAGVTTYKSKQTKTTMKKPEKTPEKKAKTTMGNPVKKEEKKEDAKPSTETKSPEKEEQTKTVSEKEQRENTGKANTDKPENKTTEEPKAETPHRKITYDMNFDASALFGNMAGNTAKEYYYEDDIEVLPHAEVEVEYIQPEAPVQAPENQNGSKIKKKALMLVAMLMVMVGIPLIISLAGNRNSLVDKTAVLQNRKETTSGVQEMYYEEAKRESTETIDNATSSSRFANLDELSLYIDSNTGFLLSSETQTANMLSNNMITAGTFNTEMQKYIAEANELNHLLIINKSVYEKEGRTEEYNRLMENLNTLIIYGDTAVYNACN